MAQSDVFQFGFPTIDRPFGLKLWPIFEVVFESIKGYKPQDFRFVSGETPLSTFPSTAFVLVSYYIIIFGGRELMRDRPALQMNWLFKVHNLYLTIISGVLLALFAEQLIPTLYRHGVFYAICNNDGGWSDELVILYYVCTEQLQKPRRNELMWSSLIISPSTLNCWTQFSFSLRRSHLVSDLRI